MGPQINTATFDLFSRVSAMNVKLITHYGTIAIHCRRAGNLTASWDLIALCHRLEPFPSLVITVVLLIPFSKLIESQHTKAT